ncbi:MAG: ABC transporter ATP-binding protein [Neofamilia sp.]
MILNVVNGSFGYGNGRNLLNNINFSVDSGEVLTVLGPNGVGKTTMLKCSIGLLEWNKGDTFLKEKNIKEISPKSLYKEISYVPQAKYLAFSYSIENLVLMGRSTHIGLFSKPKARDIEIAHDALNELGIYHLKDKNCNAISGGELQLALISRSLAQEAKILVLDEPESNLDFKNQLLILNTIRKLADNGKTCIFNTHYPEHALNIGDKALILGRDSQPVFGNVKDVIVEENLENVFSVNVDIKENYAGSRPYTTVTALDII